MPQIQYLVVPAGDDNWRERCRQFVTNHKQIISSGKAIKWLSRWSGGFTGMNLCLIKKGDTFTANFGYDDLTTFPARIKAMATSLRDDDMLNLYILGHKDGVFIVIPIPKKSVQPGLSTLPWVIPMDLDDEFRKELEEHGFGDILEEADQGRQLSEDIFSRETEVADGDENGFVVIR